MILMGSIGWGTPTTLDAHVARVIDGDTIQIISPKKKLQHVRLYGIDAPELGQKSGVASSRYLSNRIENKRVHIVLHGTDYYGRLLGEIYDNNGQNINKEMVQFGLAWVYRRAVQNAQWLKLDRTAKKKRVGLWRGHFPTPPWQYRKQTTT